MEWLDAKSDLVTNILDLVSFVLVTPDIVGKERLERFSGWIGRTNPLALMRQTDGFVPSAKLVGAAIILAVFVLASAKFFDRSGRWAETLPVWPRYAMYAVNGLWGGLFIFLLIPSLYTVGVGAVVLAVEFLRLTIVKWQISGVMLAIGAFLFACSRFLAMWHALGKAG